MDSSSNNKVNTTPSLIGSSIDNFNMNTTPSSMCDNNMNTTPSSMRSMNESNSDRDPNSMRSINEDYYEGGYNQTAPSSYRSFNNEPYGFSGAQSIRSMRSSVSNISFNHTRTLVKWLVTIARDPLLYATFWIVLATAWKILPLDCGSVLRHRAEARPRAQILERSRNSIGGFTCGSRSCCRLLLADGCCCCLAHLLRFISYFPERSAAIII
jgi:hypothetical protein